MLQLQRGWALVAKNLVLSYGSEFERSGNKLDFWLNFSKEFWRIDRKVYDFLAANLGVLILLLVYVFIQLVPFWFLSKYLSKLADDKGYVPLYWILMFVRWLVLAPLAFFLFHVSWYGLCCNYWGILVGIIIVAASAAIKDKWRY